jgi:hypothetical protein
VQDALVEGDAAVDPAFGVRIRPLSTASLRNQHFDAGCQQAFAVFRR